MTLLFSKKFTRTFPKFTAILSQIEFAIVSVKAASTISDLRDIKKLKGYNNYYRIRIGNFRIGLYIDGDTVEFVRFLHRKDIYSYFP